LITEVRMAVHPMASVALRLGGSLLLGSIPFSNIIAHSITGHDLRTVGTGTVSPTNVYRLAGLRPFAAACLLDLGKGAMAATLVKDRHPVLVAAAAGLAVAGHNWSPFLRGAGGRGVLPATGILLVAAPPGAALIVGAIGIGYLMGDTAPACLAAEVGLTPILAAIRGRGGALLGVVLAAPMLAKRLLGNDKPTADRSGYLYKTRIIYDRDVR
jgi:glycerol-3-phosphate acyltransferase PlsY